MIFKNESGETEITGGDFPIRVGNIVIEADFPFNISIKQDGRQGQEKLNIPIHGDGNGYFTYINMMGERFFVYSSGEIEYGHRNTIKALKLNDKSLKELKMLANKSDEEINRIILAALITGRLTREKEE